jgi:hypothetical protein
MKLLLQAIALLNVVPSGFMIEHARPSVRKNKSRRLPLTLGFSEISPLVQAPCNGNSFPTTAAREPLFIGSLHGSCNAVLVIPVHGGVTFASRFTPHRCNTRASMGVPRENAAAKRLKLGWAFGPCLATTWQAAKLRHP